MPEMQSLEFNQLPEAMRQRFVSSLKTSEREARPLVSQIQDNVRYLVQMFSIPVLLGMYVLNRWSDSFGQLDSEDGFWQGNQDGLFYVIATGVIVYCLLAACRSIALHRALPYTPGRYLYAFSLVDAGSSTLAHFDLAQAFDIKAVHQRDRQGRYTGTRFLFFFTGIKAQVVIETDYDRAQALGHELDRRRELLRQAYAANDAPTLFKYDPFHEVRVGGFRPEKVLPGALMAKPLAGFHRWRVLIAVIAGLVLGPTLWFVRNVQSDDAAYAAVRASATEENALKYVKQGHRHVEEVKAGLPRIAFEEARKTHSVTKIRAVRKRYPNAGLDEDVKAEVHRLYLASADKFRAQAARADSDLVPFVEQMLAALEASGNPNVQLRFTRPSSDDLQRMDSLLANFARTQGKSAEAATPWFTNKSDAEREQKIVVALQQGFAAIFPSDVMQILPTSQPDPHQPTMNIAYQINGSGRAYTMSHRDQAHPGGAFDDNRMFVGLICKFSVDVALPGQPPGWHFDLSVLPPDHFEVRDDAVGVLNQFGPSQLERVSGSSVYRVMAERAFDAMREKMRDVLFSPGSAAYARTLAQKTK
jgi:hypothetical protein